MFFPGRFYKSDVTRKEMLKVIPAGLAKLGILEQIYTGDSVEWRTFVQDNWTGVYWKGSMALYKLLDEKRLIEIENNPPAKTFSEWEKLIYSQV